MDKYFLILEDTGRLRSRHRKTTQRQTDLEADIERQHRDRQTQRNGKDRDRGSESK